MESIMGSFLAIRCNLFAAFLFPGAVDKPNQDAFHLLMGAFNFRNRHQRCNYLKFFNAIFIVWIRGQDLGKSRESLSVKPLNWRKPYLLTEQGKVYRVLILAFSAPLVGIRISACQVFWHKNSQTKNFCNGGNYYIVLLVVVVVLLD